MKFISLFSGGCDGFSIGLERAGMTCVAQVEIDERRQSVLERNHPHVQVRHGDIRNVGKHNLPNDADLICAGSPCQDFSVAGRRGGLAGERSGLFYEFIRVVSEILPKWVVFENVEGILSTNGGKDIEAVIDSFTELGYVVDIDLKDAQFFGVPQRRKRVFLTCVKLDALLHSKTNLSKQISADLLAQQLLNTWIARPQALSLVPPHSDCVKPTEQFARSQKKRKRLLKITQERLACSKSRSIWDVLLDQFGDTGEKLASSLTGNREQQEKPSQIKDMCESLLTNVGTKEGGHWSISMSLSNILEDDWWEGSKSITSTATLKTIESKIFSFAVVSLNTIALMLQSLDWSAACWSVATSASILLQENMNYAKQAVSNIFIESELRDNWWNYFCAASKVRSFIDFYLTGGRAAQILFEREGGAGLPAQSEEAREETTANAGKCDAGTSKFVGYSPRVSGTLAASGAGGNRMAGQGNEADFVVIDIQNVTSPQNGSVPRRIAPTLTGSSDVIAFDHQAGATQNIAIGKDLSPTLKRSGGGKIAVIAFNWMAGATHSISAGPISPTLLSNKTGGGGEIATISPQLIPRRLTPVEWERLQGYPDDWTRFDAKGNEISDSSRYSMIGDGIAAPVVEWIGKRIMGIERGE